MTQRRLIVVLAVMAMVIAVLAPAAFGGQDLTDQERKEAAGWGCASDVGLPDGHCISPGIAKRWPGAIIANGGTFQLLVFHAETGDFLAAEIATFKASAANRPCPNDPRATEGTYWVFANVAGSNLYVCHHQPA